MGETLEEGAKRAYLALLHPESRDIAASGYAGIILDILEEEGSLDVKDLQDRIAEEYEIEGAPKNELVDAIDYLSKKGFLSSDGRGWSLSKEGKSHLKEKQAELSDLQRRALKEFLEEYRSRNPNLTKDERHLIKKILSTVLYHLTYRLGSKISVFFEGPPPDQPDEDEILGVVQRVVEEEVGEDISEEFVDCFRVVLRDPPPALAELFGRLSHIQSILISMRLDPTLTEWADDFVSRLEVYLDTNILVGLLCEEDPYQSELWETLELLVEAGVKLRIAPPTREELSDALDTAESAERRLEAGQYRPSDNQNQFVLSYRRNKTDYDGWEDFREEKLRELGSMQETLGINISGQEVEEADVRGVKAVLMAALEGEGRAEPQVSHDAKLLVQVHGLRKAESKPLGSPWVASFDKKLPKADLRVAEALDAPPRPAIVSPETVLELVEPFVGSSGGSYRTFLKLAGRAVIPEHELLDLDDFYRYIEDECGSQEREALENYISRKQLEGKIEREFEEGKPSKGLQILVDDLQNEESLRDEKKFEEVIDKNVELHETKERLEKEKSELEKELDTLKDALNTGAVSDGADLSNENTIIINADISADADADAWSKAAVDAEFKELFDAFRRLAPEYEDQINEWEDEVEDADPEAKRDTLERMKEWVTERSEEITACNTILTHIDKLITVCGLVGA